MKGNMDELTVQLRAFIDENFLFGQGIDDLRDDDSFIEKGVIDSTGILQLVSFVEETYGIRVEDEELIADNLDSVNRVRAFITRKQAVVNDRVRVAAAATPGVRI